jgi:hypothetical protein
VSKLFTKIIVVILLVSAFHLAGSFCFEAFLDSLIKVETVQAASVTADNLMDVASVCSKDQPSRAVEKNHVPKPLSNQTNTILPCCLNGAHASTVAFYQPFELEKIAPPTIFVFYQLPLATPEIFVYHPVIIAPPELLALKTTILRL